MKNPDRLQSFTKLCLGSFVRRAFRMRCHDAAFVPDHGSAVIVANHSSYLDPILLSAVSPRPIRFFVLSDIYKLWWCRWILKAYGTVPVRGEASRGALGTGRELIRDGHLIGLFPEGQRSFDGVVGKGYPGALLLAIQGGVPVIPVGISGTYESYPRWRKIPRLWPVSVAFGSPRHYEEVEKPNRRWMDQETENLMAEIRRLVKGLEG